MFSEDSAFSRVSFDRHQVTNLHEARELPHVQNHGRECARLSAGQSQVEDACTKSHVMVGARSSKHLAQYAKAI